jgi:hypothetical protein
MVHRLIAILLGLIVMLASGACNLVITPQPAHPDRNPNGVIFSADQTQANLDVIWPAPEGTWTPTEADVLKLEADLPAFLQTAQHAWLRPDPPIWEREPEYMRQYLGIVEDGREIIYANFFCRSDDTDWRSEFVFVMDGGDCYFNVKYDPQSGEFFDFSVNGEA